MRINIITLIFFVLLLNFNTHIAFSQSGTSDKIAVYEKSYELGEIVIEIKQEHIARAWERSNEPNLCKAWLIVRAKNGKEIAKKYFDDTFKNNDGSLMPVGGPYGLFVPTKQPLKDYFVVIKEGSDESKLYIIDKKGKLYETGGGSYFVTDDGKFLFTISSAPEKSCHFWVFDSEKGKIVFTANCVFPSYCGLFDEIWHKWKNSYFYIEYTPSESNESSYDKIISKAKHVIKFDLDRLTLTRQKTNATEIKGSKKVKFNDVHTMDNCGGPYPVKPTDTENFLDMLPGN